MRRYAPMSTERLRRSSETSVTFGRNLHLNQRFIDESQGGNTLRIKLEVPGSEPMYTSYSLRGFTKAYYRAMSFSLSGSGSGYRDDSDYFR